MKFITSVYEFKKPRLSKNSKLTYLAWGIVLIIILGLGQGIISLNPFIYVVVILCVFTPPVISFLSIFSKEEHQKKLIGYLDIETDKLTWNGRKITWKDIEDISIEVTDYRGQIIHKVGDFENIQSNGLDNRIKISMKDSTNYEGNFLLESKRNIEELKITLKTVIEHNDLPQDVKDGLTNLDENSR